MNHIRKLHEEAMDLAEMAFIARLEGDLERAAQLSQQAYEGEAQAARLMSKAGATEPTRSVLYRSAASLALNCNRFREAERLIAEGLAGDPPAEIAEELRQLYENVLFHRTLDSQGVSLKPDELLMSLSGKAIGFGVAAVEEFTMRLNDIQRLLRRTVERMTHKKYTERGRASGLAGHFEFFVSGLQPGSFVVSLKIGTPKDQLILPFPILESTQIIDEILTCLELFNASEEGKLRGKIPEPEYYRNFVGVSRRIAPDGNEVDRVGFTTARKQVELTKPRDEIEISLKSQLDEEIEAEAKTEVTGVLRYANATDEEKQTIRLIDKNGRSYHIIVPTGMMSDIVKPLWDEIVTVTGFYRGKQIQLENIKKADAD